MDRLNEDLKKVIPLVEQAIACEPFSEEKIERIMAKVPLEPSETREEQMRWWAEQILAASGSAESSARPPTGSKDKKPRNGEEHGEVAAK